jgi:hypothetical protein
MIDLPDLSGIHVPLHTLVLLGFYTATGLYTVFSMIMYYHWNEYSTDEAVTRITTILYLVTTAPIILTIGIITFFIY